LSSAVSLPRVHVPITRPEDVIPHLGSPTHWQPGRSAKCVADSWFCANGIPQSVATVLEGDPVFRSATLIDAFLERGVDLGDGARPSQTDLMAIVGLDEGLGVLAVEAKVDEPFGPTVDEWLADKDRDASQKLERLRSLCATLGVDAAVVGALRYQLLHRTVSAVLETRRYRAAHAMMLVQSFCTKGSWHKDFQAFSSTVGFGAVPIGSVSAPKACGDVSLRIGWVSDPAQGPFTRLNTPRTVTSLTELGRQRLSKTFFMRDMLFSEVAAIHGLNNAPDDPALALAAGRGLCENLLEPLQDHWGRLAIRSAYRSSEVNGFCNAMQRAKKSGYTCASNEANYAAHIWDRRDAAGFMGATACVVIPRFWEARQTPGDWRILAKWIDEHLPHAGLEFFPTYWAFNISWSENPQAARTISSYAEPRGQWRP
jgi:hypothetical protein